MGYLIPANSANSSPEVPLRSNSSSNSCRRAAYVRVTQRNGIIDQAENKLFLKACLGKATRPGGFCDGVPPLGEIMQSASWAVQRCSAKGKTGDQNCARMMQVLQDVCAPPG